MAKKIEWTQTAIQDWFKIYQFWIKKNKNSLFSEKLEGLFKEAANLISEFPEIGTQTDFPNLRVKVIKNYKLFYMNTNSIIFIIRVWDTRQNPENLEFLWEIFYFKFSIELRDQLIPEVFNQPHETHPSPRSQVLSLLISSQSTDCFSKWTGCFLLYIPIPIPDETSSGHMYFQLP